MNHHETSVAIITTNNDKIESIIESQKKSLQDALNDIRALLGITLFVVCIEWLYTDFLDFPFFQPISIAHIQNFTLLFLLELSRVTTVMMLSGSNLYTSKKDDYIFALHTASKTLDTLYEELSGRCIYVCLSMMILTIINVVMGSFLSLCIVALIIISGSRKIEKNGTKIMRIVGIVQIIIGMFILWMYLSVLNPIDWMATHFWIPVVDTTSFGFIHETLYGYPPLLILSMIFCNITFCLRYRNYGHLKMIHTWYIGLILIYATIHYGVWVAICIHLIVNLQSIFLWYVLHKFQKYIEEQ